MPNWSEILSELQASATANGGIPQFDGVRRSYLHRLADHTKRNTILYVSKFTQPVSPEVGQMASIVDGDLQAMMTVVHGLQGPDLDLILHSPGGSPEAAESIVSYLRSKFSSVRVIVPHLAMSAATMIACASDAIVMGKHSFLGPIDPQIVVLTPTGPRMVPAQAILDQFGLAKQECQDPKKMGAWMPMLAQYGPALLVQCQNANALSEQLVRDWLERFMLANHNEKARLAKDVACWLAAHTHWKSHNRHIPRDNLAKHGLCVEHLEADPVAQDLVLSAFHASIHTLDATPTVKIIENHKGVAFIQQMMHVPVGVPMPPPGSPVPVVPKPVRPNPAHPSLPQRPQR